MSALSITTSNDLSSLAQNSDSLPFANDSRGNGPIISDAQTLGGHSHTDGQPAQTDDTILSRRLESSTPLKSPTLPSNQTSLMNLAETRTHSDAPGPELLAMANIDSTAMELDAAQPELLVLLFSRM
jgi:hypothetical protein